MYKKEIRELFIEIIITIIIIFISIGIWNKICIMSRNNKQIAELYSKEKLSILNIDKYENEIAKLSNKESISPTIIRVHNVSGNNNGIKFTLKLSNDIEKIINYLIIEINDNYYNLNELIDSKDNNYYYIKISQDKYTKYETKTFKIKLLIKDDYDISNNYYNYEFLTNTL